jgi:peptide methionine sulfoxide reductase msrA/msrB
LTRASSREETLIWHGRSKVPGVVEVISGYTGGHKENPTYEEVSAGGTGHVEAAQVLYDPKRVSYEELLDVFWHHVDPTDPDGQLVDRGPQYRTGIFYHDKAQRRLAEESKKKLADSMRFDKPMIRKINKEIKSGFAQDEIETFKRVLRSLLEKFNRSEKTRADFQRGLSGRTSKNAKPPSRKGRK